MTKQLKSFIHNGGIKLKLIGFLILSILMTIFIQNLFTIPMMKNYAQKKAFEVSITTIERIADFSLFTLLERTPENRINLNDIIQNIQSSHIEGLIGMSIFEKEKNNTNVKYNLLAGFGYHQKKLDKKLSSFLNNIQSNKVTFSSYPMVVKTTSLETYRFVKPIIYHLNNKKILLGVALLYYDKEAITGFIEKMLNIIYFVTFLIIVVAVFIVYFVGLSFTKPILTITQAAKDVTNGKLDIDLKVTTNDEIEDLAESFNAMSKSLREHKNMQKFVSNSTVDMIQENSSCPLILGGEYRELTFLFSDIRHFTTISESRDPNELIEILNFYLNLQSEIINTYGGDIDKFVGDEVIAFFSGTDSAQKAIECAVAIQTAITSENKQREQHGMTVCEVGIGINKGDVVVGNIGSHERMDFTSIGSVVNIASRLCSHAKAREILIETTTYENSDSQLKALKQEPLQAKGIKKPISVYSFCVTQENSK